MSAPKVLIVGAGLTGCTLAHRLAQAGCGSVLLDREAVGAERTFFAGRLANYVYIDMDDCMRQALDTAEQVLATR
ncbi:MAG: hypothetical protein QOH76_3747 [Thermoleophilaceae bacterium]|jgi:UDP-galactopyranose mutase|nr:hypothetical protein [Thermoleophilaceae bacterium]